MGCYTYINDQEAENWSKVSDSELNELLQEARKCDNSLLVSETEVITYRWFRKPSTEIRYTVYHESRAADGSRYQARHQLCIDGSYRSVATYLYGIINGHNALLEKHNSQFKNEKI